MKRGFVFIALPSVFPSREERHSHTVKKSIKKSIDTVNRTNQVGLIDLMEKLHVGGYFTSNALVNT